MLSDVFDQRERETNWFQDALSVNKPGTGFETWFQPVVDTRRHQLVGQECLIRFSGDRDRAGNEILSAARSGNLLAEFDIRAVRLAIRSAGVQQRQGRSKGPWFINFLPTAISDLKCFTSLVMDALVEACLVPKNIIFEVVESDLTGDSARLRAVLDSLRARGFGFSLDNAGIGTNAFQLICDLRPDYVKIDRRLAWNAEQPFCATTIRKLVELADLNGVQPIAAGIERARTVENLWLLGVHLMQGYLFGRPSPTVARSAARSDLENLARVLSPTCESLASHDPAPVFADLH